MNQGDNSAPDRPLSAQHDGGLSGIMARREPAVFEFFVRRLPERRGFLLAAGLEQALDFLESLRFSPDELDWLARPGGSRRGSSTISRASASPATCTPWRRARVFFADEPILRVTAPLPEAQLVETRLINLLHFQSLIASKAARMVLAAPGKLLVDFGLRRAHGAEAGLLAARASYIAGFAGTATVLAEQAVRHPDLRHHGAFVRRGARRRGARPSSDFARARPRRPRRC